MSTSPPARRRPGPLVYACAGYSSAAQLANTLALRLDAEGVAEMSCIAGVGGAVPVLVGLARSGRPIVALDGCPLRCVEACLARVGARASVHLVLSDLGVRKQRLQGVDPADAERVGEEVLRRIHAAGLGSVVVGTSALPLNT